MFHQWNIHDLVDILDLWHLNLWQTQGALTVYITMTFLALELRSGIFLFIAAMFI